MSGLLAELAERRAFRPAVRLRTWRRLAAQTRSRLPLLACLSAHEKRAAEKNPALAGIFKKLRTSRASGSSLAEALDGRITPEEAMLLAAGERTGDYAGGFALSAELLETRARLTRAVRSSLAYPAFLLLLAVAVLTLVSKMIVPQLAAVMPADQWQGLAAALLAVANFAGSAKGATALGLLLCGLVAAIVTLPTWTGEGRRRVDGLAIWGIYRAVTGAVWLHTLAVLVRAGGSVRGILADMVENPATTPWLKERLLAALAAYAAGLSLGEALDRTGYGFPCEEAIDDLTALAGLPDMEGRLLLIAREQLDEAVSSVRAKASAVGLALLFVVFGLAGLSLGGIFSFQQQFAAMVSQ